MDVADEKQDLTARVGRADLLNRCALNRHIQHPERIGLPVRSVVVGEVAVNLSTLREVEQHPTARELTKCRPVLGCRVLWDQRSDRAPLRNGVRVIAVDLLVKVRLVL